MTDANVFSGVADTLYIPLVSRIYVSKRFPGFFHDGKALSLEGCIPSDAIEKNSSEYGCMASACRQRVMDGVIRGFLEMCQACNLVFLGAGLETACFRVDCSKAKVYQVDLPDVIEVRRKALGALENETLIGGDMFDMGWADGIDGSLPTLVVVSGVYQYFEEEKVAGNVREIAKRFPKGELVFDATNSDGLKYTNRYVEKTGNTDALMRFGLDDPQAFAEKCGVKLVSVSGFFDDALKTKLKLKLSTKVFMRMADKWKRTMVVRLSLAQ